MLHGTIPLQSLPMEGALSLLQLCWGGVGELSVGHLCVEISWGRKPEIRILRRQELTQYLFIHIVRNIRLYVQRASLCATTKSYVSPHEAMQLFQ